MTARPEIHLHINPRDLQGWRGRPRLAVFTRLAEMCETRGLTFRAVARTAEEMQRGHQVSPDGNIHVVENGRVEADGWLNTALAYLLGFWQLDPRGVHSDSAASRAVFEAEEVDGDAADRFFARLNKQLVQRRRSRFQQPREVAQDLPQGAVALFLQGPSAFFMGRCNLSMDELILAVAQGAGGRPVLVKPHPQVLEDGRAAIDRAIAGGARVQATEANVHDVLAAAAVTVSVNSAAAMEGFLHRKPAILFGRSGFPSLVTQADGAADFPAALETALATDWPYAKMVHWYLSRHALDLAAPDFEDRAFAAFARVGVPRERFGL